MQEFLSGAMLAKRIRKVCEGEDCRIAVAYWGTGIPEALSLDACGSSRIICDVSSGGTNPAALKSLGAPNNDNLRHIPKLHAKVYISSVGVVVGSANASDNGIGRTPVTLEAGIFCKSEGDSGTNAADWFEERWSDAKQIDAAALAWCEQNWRRSAASRAIEAKMRQNAPVTLPKLLEENPAVFGDIEFLLTNEPIDRVARDAALQMNEDEEPDQDPTRFCLFGWGDDDDKMVPSRFISIHRGLRGAYWLSLLTPGFLRSDIGVYCAVPHPIAQGPFADLNDVLSLKQYRNWREGGAGYSLGQGAFDEDTFGDAVDKFYTAEELSELLCQ